MLSLIWRHEARQDLLDLTSYIGVRNPAAAERIGMAIEHTVARLTFAPPHHILSR